MTYRGTLSVTAALLSIALVSCASAPEPEPSHQAALARPAPPPATPEFHGARIGSDALRSRLVTE